MRIKLIVLAVLSVGFNLITGLQAQNFEPLPIDPQLRYGKLENGMTYYIRHNEQPKGRADFYIVQNVGSILEEENQRGLAHFLEHMAFDGTENFPNTKIDDFTTGLGIRLGENLNAYTGFDETVYTIMNAPVDKKNNIDSLLLILHDWSQFITLADSAIEKERGVIREEWRTRQDAQARIWEQQFPKLFPGSRYADRLPIGTIDVINNFKSDELREYYKKWYRPDLQALVVVGDIDVDYIESKIRTMFSDIPAPVNPAERIYYEVPDNEKPLVSIAKDREATSLTLYIFYKHDRLPRELSGMLAGFISDYYSNVTAFVLNARLSELLQKSDPPFIFSTVYDGEYLVAKTKDAWTAAALVEEGAVENAVFALVSEIERARQHGFTASEYERARLDILKDYEVAYNERNNQKNSSYTNEYVQHFTDGGYIPGIEVEYTLMNQLAPAIPVEQINAYFQEAITDRNIAVSLTGPDKEDAVYPSEADLLAAFRTAHNSPVEPYVEEISDEPLITELPAAGEIVDIVEDPHFGATVMQLSNGVKVVLKHTDFKKDQILMTATSPGGGTLFGNEDIGNLKVFNDVVNLGGLGNFSATDLSKVLAGKKVNISTNLGLNNENLNGSAVPGDIETLFQLIYLTFTANRTDTEAYDSYISRMKAQLQNMDLNPMVAFNDSLTSTVYYDNLRAKRLSLEDFDHISYPRIMEMYRERYGDASDFVFTFVGNLQVEEMKPLIRQYLASLPSLGRVEAGDPSVVPVIRTGLIKNVFRREMEIPKASVFNFYYGHTGYTLENNITATFLRQILDLVYTEKIRESEGGSYGVQALVVISRFPEGESYIQTFFDTDPEKQERMSEIIYEELTHMAEKGPSIDDFNKTKENMLKRFSENQEENGYWLNVLDNYYYYGYDGYTDYKKIVESMTPEKIRLFTQQLLGQGNSIEIIMLP